MYRRWTDRESLVADAITDSIAREVPIPNTGEVETDLREHARSLVGWLTSPTGEAIISTMISGEHIPEIAEIKRRFFEDRLRRAEPIVARAIARGELPVGTDSAQVIKTLIAPIYLRLLITAEPLAETPPPTRHALRSPRHARAHCSTRNQALRSGQSLASGSIR